MKAYPLAALLAIAPLAAQAADLYAPPSTSDPSYTASNDFDWAGLYVGGVAGYGWGDATHCDSGASCSVFFADNDLDGWLGGATLGYNFQWGNLVLGVEADASLGSLEGSIEFPPSGFVCGSECRSAVTALATVRGRAGYAFNRFLPFVTVGVGVTWLEASLGDSSGDTTRTSLVWGGGFEYGLTERCSAKAEYIRVEKLDDFVYDEAGGCDGQCYLTDLDYDLVRAGLNYRFR